MKKLSILSLLALSATTYAATPWSAQLSFNQPFFYGASTSTVNIQQSPHSPVLTAVVNTNKIEKAEPGINASIIYDFKQKAHWHFGAGLNLSEFKLPVSGVGKVSTFTLDQYTYDVSIYDLDAFLNADYQMRKWTLGAQLLLGASRAHAGNYKAQDSTTLYASNIKWNLSYGVQLHALYALKPNLVAGVQAAYRNDGESILGARKNVYSSKGSIKQKVHFTYIGLVFGVKF